MKAGIWVYCKNGKLKTKLSPHKFRHTMATQLLNCSGELVMVKDALGHRRVDTTNIYAKSLPDKKEKAMDEMHEILWSGKVTQLQKSDDPEDKEKCG